MKQIRISKKAVNSSIANQYTNLAYMFIKIKQGMIFGDVTFTINDFCETCHIPKVTQANTYKKAIEALQEIIDLYCDKDIKNSIFHKNINYDALHSSLKKEIHFFIKDVTMDCKNGNFIIINGDNIEKIINHSRYLLDSKKTKISYSADLINVYCYILSRMSYRKLKNENGVEHYSNNPIYFYSYKNNILEDLNMSLIHFNKIFKMLSDDLNLIREVKFKKHMVKEKGRETYFINFPNFYFVENNELEENLKNAMNKYCKEKGVERKTLVPNFK